MLVLTPKNFEIRCEALVEKVGERKFGIILDILMMVI